MSDESLEEENKWGLNFKTVKTLWADIILKKYCYKPDICQTCFKGNFALKESKDANIINPYYLRCNNKSCRKRVNLRAFSFLVNLRYTPASVTFEILYKF